MGVTIDHARVEVSARFSTEGSVLAGSIRAVNHGVSATIKVTSQEPPERVAALLRNAENGCYMLYTIREPVEATTTVELNGAPFDYLAR